jgi:hypothetical protein
MKTMRKGVLVIALLAGLSALCFAAELPVVTIMSPDPLATEGIKDPASVVVSRTGEVDADLMVSYTIGGTATNGKDYETLPGSVKIPAGVDSTIIMINPLPDRETEGTETVILKLSEDPAYKVGDPGEATIVIKEK